jgi:hypothetical protein
MRLTSANGFMLICFRRVGDLQSLSSARPRLCAPTTIAGPEQTIYNPSLNQTTKMRHGGWFKRFLPRSRSKAIFIFAMTCYSLTLTDIDARLIRLWGLWPVKVDPITHVLRPVRPGIDDSKIIDLLLISPVIESLIVIGVIELLRRLKFNIPTQIITSVSLVCLLHGIGSPFFAFLVAPAFFIMAGAYIYWRRISFWSGAQVIILVHFFGNVVPFISVMGEYLHR